MTVAGLTDAQKAQVLTAALPYIQKYAGKIVVVKYGGSAMTDASLKRAVMSDILLLECIGIKVVLVHGGGPEISAMLTRLGIESRFVDGLRCTDEPTAEVVQMVLAGKTNKDLVGLIGGLGGRALGVCGIDGGLLVAEKRREGPDLGYVGEIAAVHPGLVLDALAHGYIPVVASVAAGEDGTVYNVNADTAACALAAALGAENIVMLTDTRGLMERVGDESTLIPAVAVGEVESYIRSGVISGGMIPKIRSCAAAVCAGVRKAVLIDGRVPHSILIEMFSDEGIGTLLTKGEEK